MPAPAPEDLRAQVAELEARLRAVLDENDHLAEAQTDVVLLGMIAEAVARETDADAILEAGLERMSVLADLPVCLAALHEGDRLVARAAHVGHAHAEPGTVVLAPAREVLAALGAGPVPLVGAEACAGAGLAPAGAAGPGGVVPRAALFLPFDSRALGRGAFVLADGRADGRLVRSAAVLERAAEIVLARLENAALLDALVTLSAAVERRAADRAAAIAASEARLRRGVEAASACAFDWDLAADACTFSEGAAALLGVDPRSRRSAPEAFGACVHPDDRDAVLAALARARSGEGAAPVRASFRLAGEPARWHELQARALDRDLPRVAGLVLDATERHAVEEDRLHAQKMESVGRLAGGIAHDFNNLLTTVLSVSEMLLVGLPEGDPAREDVAAVREAGRRAAALTRQLLAFSRRQRLDVRPVQLDEVLRGFAPMIARLIGEDVAVKLDLAASLPPVLADPSQVEQILMNLAVNARDAMPAGGTLSFTLSPARVDLGTSPSPGTYVRLEVADTGDGMEPEIAARIFEPFFSRKGAAGNGLGLATVYGIVTQHGGAISVRSAPGGGSTFDVLLPATEPVAAATPPSETLPARAGRGETVLVVDDEPLVRRAIGRCLKSRGYVVLEAGSGEEALATVSARGGVDLLLTDVVMPGMRGPELVHAFQAQCPGRPALLMSGYPAAGGGEAPAGGWLEKPVTPEVLARAIRDALDRAG
jgi:two-component system, cell cycle sensor histidine kinase and response regulator CckA